jgi:hypothetical protein
MGYVEIAAGTASRGTIARATRALALVKAVLRGVRGFGRENE